MNSSPVALVTGSGRARVGNLIARRLAARGYRIALHYHRSREEAMQACDELRDQGCDCEALQADVTSEAEVARLFGEVDERFGRIDALVTTASIWQTGSLEDSTAEMVRRNFDVNVLGTFLPAREAGLRMVEQPTGGAIVTFGDWAIKRPYVDHVAYFISKGAIPTLTRTLAAELGHRNPKVRCNCIHPGPIMLPPQASDAERDELTQATLVKQADCPEAAALAVEFLIDNPFITGVCLPVDGGRHMYTPDGERRTRSDAEA